ncbi:hypothetical protein GQ44DRAFT_699416 [Phaeosphaeriaceae sp. PMI808]|nr:hypothetical protein GQ44DRAFT_699416 [Phaeosphaeriaceae sp. PMI808]
MVFGQIGVSCWLTQVCQCLDQEARKARPEIEGVSSSWIVTCMVGQMGCRDSCMRPSHDAGNSFRPKREVSKDHCSAGTQSA